MIPVLAVVEVSRSLLTCAGLGVLVAIALVAFSRVRAKHHKAAQAAAKILRQEKLGVFADPLDAYAIDDFQGVITTSETLVDTLKDPAKRDLTFTEFALALLKAKLKNPDVRDATIKVVNDLIATTAPGGATPAQLTQDKTDMASLLKTLSQPAPTASGVSIGALPADHQVTVAGPKTAAPAASSAA